MAKKSYRGRLLDPCCGSGPAPAGFVSSEKFMEERGGSVGDIAVYGQESNYTTWKAARMNLAIRGIDANLGPRNADSFRQDLHPDVRGGFVLAMAACPPKSSAKFVLCPRRASA